MSDNQRLVGGAAVKALSGAMGALLLLSGAPAFAEPHPPCTGPQLGTWKLQSETTEDLETHEKTSLLGDHPSGYLNYGADCRMYAILTQGDRKAPAGAVATDAEGAELYRGLVAYAGTYTIEGDKVSHHVDISWNQAWTGTTLVRQFRIEGKSLYIRTAPAKNRVTGRLSVTSLVWTKID